MYLPLVFTDAELRQVDCPTLLLMGGRGVAFSPRAALERAARLMPHLEAEIIPGAAHALSLDQPEKVNRRMLEFLQKSGG
jgi:pimeloyl-ACP methyl ester carboxylesterase